MVENDKDMKAMGDREKNLRGEEKKIKKKEEENKKE